MNVGIDLISFYTPQYFLDLKVLAEERGVDPDKFTIGIGQERMAVPPPDEDIVTMAASAALPIVEKAGRNDIELLMFATESAVDQSKAAAMFAHSLLGLPRRCRALETKQACYSGTACIQLATSWIAAHPGKKALVLCADIARYDLGSPGEPTQGAGAVAMLIAENPRVLALDPECGLYAEDVMDFWRPNYREEALVDGKYSMRVYIAALEESWRQYAAQSKRAFKDFAKFLYHLPFTKMAEKAHVRLRRAAGQPAAGEQDHAREIGESLRYNRITGNTYTASMYEGMNSLFDTCPDDLGGQRIGMFSYGSGCMGEYFSGVVRPGYRGHLLSENHRNLLENRAELTYQQYEDIFRLGIPTDGRDHAFAEYRTGHFRLAGVNQHKRTYEQVK